MPVGRETIVTPSIQDRLNFSEINEETSKSLQDMTPVLEKHLPDVLKSFYEHVKDYPELANMFNGQEGMDRAKSLQTTHWKGILDGSFGDNYVISVQKIGKRHNIIGLEPKWYIGGYSYIATRILDGLIKDQCTSILARGKKETLSKNINAFVKALMLDIDLAISTYLEAAKADRETLMNELSTHFENDVQQIVSSLLDSSENASNHVQTVAAAAEELTASINEISSQVTYTANSAKETAEIVEKTSAQAALLGEAAEKIGEIVDIIQDIAEKTNLLSLNAAIEAARAGEAGKGFAVVASEVKGLAGKTAEETKEIVKQIDAIQTEARKTVEGLEAIVSKVADVQNRSGSVATSIEEQQAATAEISHSMQQASGGAQETTHQARTLKTKVDAFLLELSSEQNTAKSDRPTDAKTSEETHQVPSDDEWKKRLMELEAEVKKSEAK
ncbi:MAG: chemotaxis protein [Micavibrio sp.]|nr:chemotaxis protein [Micavibrio sp.]HCK32251.1 chemotaxis protein [Rhodospirillaceae bacterium]